MILVRIDSAEHFRHQRIREVILFSWCTRWCRPSLKFLRCVLCASYRESVALLRKLFLYLPSVALLVCHHSQCLCCSSVFQLLVIQASALVIASEFMSSSGKLTSRRSGLRVSSLLGVSLNCSPTVSVFLLSFLGYFHLGP